jgi:hypothetical protein
MSHGGPPLNFFFPAGDSGTGMKVLLSRAGVRGLVPTILLTVQSGTQKRLLAEGAERPAANLVRVRASFTGFYVT